MLDSAVPAFRVVHGKVRMRKRPFAATVAAQLSKPEADPHPEATPSKQRGGSRSPQIRLPDQAEDPVPGSPQWESNNEPTNPSQKELIPPASRFSPKCVRIHFNDA